MLVLTRKPGERILIGDDIVVTLIAVRRDNDYGEKIRIGLEAPSTVSIRREEVPDQRKAPPGAAEASLPPVEAEARQLRQKIEAIGHQTARECRAPSPDARRIGELSDVLLALRRRCDELLEQLGKTAAPGEKSQIPPDDS